MAKPVFEETECYWPSAVTVDEEFTTKLSWLNEGASGLCWLGFQYKGAYYGVWFEGQETFEMDANQLIRAELTTTIRKFFNAGGEPIETWDRSKTIDITFIVGPVEEETFYITDTWPASTYVEVEKLPGKLAAIPWWAYALGGMTIIGVTVAMVRRKK